jgi:ABC-type multidrug transport system ATPase subunit
LTVEQSLKLFANLRGLESDFVSSTVNDMIKVFKLDEFRDKLVQDLR